MDEALIGSLIASTLRVSTPLILCALAAVLSERSGVIDLGLEGKMLMCAFAAASTGALTGSMALALLAALCAVAIWLFLWKTRAGYELRAVGFAPEAAHYAGILPRRQVMVSMLISGALAGLVAVNELAGVQGRLLLDFVAGAGFTGIAVSLIGRNHPAGIVLASLLFGALYQGGAELAFEIPGFSREMVGTLQGLIVLFSGAMAYVAAPWLARLHGLFKRQELAHG